MALTDELRRQIDDLVTKNRVVLFMKGNRRFPQCGFSAKVVAILDGLAATYETVNVLQDQAIREAIKEYSQWPTIPQLYVAGQFVGGSDIVSDMGSSGELQRLIGASFSPAQPEAQGARPATPQVTITDGALRAFRDAGSEAGDEVVRLEISGTFEYDLSIGPRAKGDVEIPAGALSLVLDPASAGRADGVTIDFVPTADGGAFKITSPHQPRVRPITAPELRAWFDEGRTFELFDVRPEGERALAKLDRARSLDAVGKSGLLALDRKTPLVFHCHHGSRSRAAAEDALRAGFSEVYNLEGGLDAWSLHVDGSVPRY